MQAHVDYNGKRTAICKETSASVMTIATLGSKIPCGAVVSTIVLPVPAYVSPEPFRPLATQEQRNKQPRHMSQLTVSSISLNLASWSGKY